MTDFDAARAVAQSAVRAAATRAVQEAGPATLDEACAKIQYNRAVIDPSALRAHIDSSIFMMPIKDASKVQVDGFELNYAVMERDDQDVITGASMFSEPPEGVYETLLMVNDDIRQELHTNGLVTIASSRSTEAIERLEFQMGLGIQKVDNYVDYLCEIAPCVFITGNILEATAVQLDLGDQVTVVYYNPYDAACDSVRES